MGIDFTPQLLIVDDREENLSLLKVLFRDLEVNLKLVKSSVKALQLIEKEEYALVILDIQMPQIDGFLLAQKIRAGNKNKSTPIIFLTAFFLDKESELKGYRCGGVDFIMKPFDSIILINKVNIFLELYKNRCLLEFKNQKLTSLLKEKHLLEGRLRSLASNYRSIIEGQTELILKLDYALRVEFANKAFSDFFNFSIDNVAKDLLSVISIVLQEQISKAIKQLNGKNRVCIIEEKIHNPEGNLCHLEWTIYREIEFGEICYLAIGRDITIRKRIKDSLVKKENILNKIQKKAKIGSWEWDSYSKIVRGSDVFLALYNISPSFKGDILEIIKQKVHPDDRIAIERLFLYLPKKNQKFEFEHRYLCNNGTEKHLRVEMYSEYKPVTDVFNLYGFAWDISEEKNLELNFKESLSFGNEAYTDKAIFELNKNNQVTYLNDYAIGFLGCQSLKSVENVDFTSFFIDSDVPRVKRILKSILSKKRFAFELLSIVTKQNTKKRIVLAAHAIHRNNQKSVRGIMMEIIADSRTKNSSLDDEDTTLVLKRKEKEFKRNTRKLEEKIEKELKANDFHRDLLVKKSELESLGKMASSMVNEINQPLSGISMAIDNLLLRLSKNNIEEDYIREKCTLVFADIERIKKYLSQIGIFNSSNKKKDFKESINVNLTVRDSINLIQKQYKNSKVELSFEECQTDLYVIGNKYKFQKMIVDILNNAYDALGDLFMNTEIKNEKCIKVKTYLEGDDVIISVLDNGGGISSDNLKYIFDPFFTTKKSGISSGLGLYFSKGVVQKMNGRIDVVSEENKFTEMRLILPFETQTIKSEQSYPKKSTVIKST